jgi:hypothetical protein
MEKCAEDVQILAHHNRGKILFFKGEGGNMISPDEVRKDVKDLSYPASKTVRLS